MRKMGPKCDVFGKSRGGVIYKMVTVVTVVTGAFSQAWATLRQSVTILRKEEKQNGYSGYKMVTERLQVLKLKRTKWLQNGYRLLRLREKELLLATLSCNQCNQKKHKTPVGFVRRET